MPYSAVRAVCLGFSLLLVAVGTGQGTPAASGPEIPIFDFKSYDLGKIRWYASADLPPDSSMETIRAEGTPTTPTVTLRSAVHGGTGMLFCFVQLPDPLPPGSAGRITIGDIDGNDESFWNGKPIGKTSGWGIGDYRPRMYTIDRGDLKPGVNIFAMRLSGPGGRPTFGVKSKTLTFSLIPEPRPELAAPTDNPTSSVPSVNIELARQTIVESDPEVSATLLQRKRPSFGRFGEFYHNGLPAVSEVSPTRIATRQAPAFDVGLDYVQSLETVRGAEEPGIDGWHTLTRVRGMARGTSISYTLRQNVLYPGAVISLEQGSVLEFRIHFPQRQGQVLPMSEGERKEIFGDESDLAVYGFLPLGDQSTPAILAASGLSVNVTQALSHIDVSLARNGSTGDARVYIFYPIGLYRIEAKPDQFKTLSDVAAASRLDVDKMDVMRQWMRIGLHEPVGVDEYFAPVKNDTHVRIFQAMRFRGAPGVDLGGPLLIRPPQVDYVQQTMGYPVDSETTSTGVLAFSGDMHFSHPINTESTATASLSGDQKVHVISYDLPVPPIRERATLDLGTHPELTTMINQYALQDMGSSISLNAVDALYKSRTQGYHAYSFLDADKRKQLADNSAATIRAALGGHFWQHGQERFSGLDYWYTSYLQGPYFKKFDQDWGNGLSLYGLQTYVKYTSDWRLPANNWPVVERIFAWFTVSDDWEWMRASNSTFGHGTGAGDGQNATYAAAIAYTKLAKGAGRQAEYHYGLYTLARTAILSISRFAYSDFAVANNFKGEHSLVLGFHEGQGFLEGELEGYPWNVTSNISANGIQPETYDFFMASGQDALRNYEQIFEKNFPEWVDGNYSYPYKTLYQGNSGYITLPHIYLRSRLGGDSFATLNEYLERARTNNYLWWISPPVIGEISAKKADGVMVTEWENAAFGGGRIEPLDSEEHDGRFKLTLNVDNPENSANTIQIRLPRRPHQFDINGGPVPLTDSQFEDGTLSLKVRRPGNNTIMVIYSER